MWFYATPILYPITQVPEEYELLGRRDPDAPASWRRTRWPAFAEAYRDAFYDLRAPSLGEIGILAAWAIGSLIFGWLVFRRLEPRLAEEL